MDDLLTEARALARARPIRVDERPTSPDHEADLICVVDDQVHLCEVKSSARDIETESLVEVAMRLRPDVVTLAVMESPSARLTSKLEELKRGIDSNGIEAKLLTLRPDRFSDGADLPTSSRRFFVFRSDVA